MKTAFGKIAVSGKTPLAMRRENRRDAFLRAFSVQKAADGENAVAITPPPSRECIISAPRAHKTHKKYPKTTVISTGSMTAMQLSACATVKAVFEPVENTVDTFPALDKYPKTAVFTKVSASFRRKLGSRTQVLRHKYPKTTVISTGSMTVMQLSACATVKAVFEPVENTVDVFFLSKSQDFNCRLNPFPKPFGYMARVFAVFVSVANKNASGDSKSLICGAIRKLVSKSLICDASTKACDVDAFPALNKYAKTAVDGLPAFNKCLETAVDGLPALDKYAKIAVYGLPALNKYPKTAVDALPALDKYPKTAVDGLSSLEERTKTAVDGILSRRGRVTTAVAALSCGFSARFALGYSITQKIKRGIFL